MAKKRKKVKKKRGKKSRKKKVVELSPAMLRGQIEAQLNSIVENIDDIKLDGLIHEDLKMTNKSLEIVQLITSALADSFTSMDRQMAFSEHDRTVISEMIKKHHPYAE